MKEQMEAIRLRVAKMSITGESGAGMVKITVNGEGTITNVKIDPTLLIPAEKDMLEELLISAGNEALRKAREAAAHELKSAAGLNIPGLEKLFGG